MDAAQQRFGRGAPGGRQSTRERGSFVLRIVKRTTFPIEAGARTRTSSTALGRNLARRRNLRRRSTDLAARRSLTCLTRLKQPLPLQRSWIVTPAGARRTLRRVTRVKRGKSEKRLRMGVVTRGTRGVMSVASEPIVVPIALVATTRKWTVDRGVRPVSSPGTATSLLPAASATGAEELPYAAEGP